MARLPITVTTLKALFAKSGNLCCFPECTHPLMNEDNLFIGQLCHITSPTPDGPRFDRRISDEELRDYDNLILMCYAHHRVIDNDPEYYSIDKLKQFKNDHEMRGATVSFHIEDQVIKSIAKETTHYWANLERVQQSEHPIAELAFELHPNTTFSELSDQIHDLLNSLEELAEKLNESNEKLDDDFKSLLDRFKYDRMPYDAMPYDENPFINRNWEEHNLGMPNHIGKIRILLKQLEVKYYETYLKLNNNNKEAKEQFEKIKLELEELAKTTSYID